MGKTEESYEYPFESVQESPGFLLWQIAMCWQRSVNKILSEYELTYTQFIVMVIAGWLKQKNENIYQHQIARHARIDRMMTSRIMASLERKKYVQRFKQSADARTNLVTLTEKGENILFESLRAVNKAENDFFKPSTKSSGSFLKYMKELLPEC